MFTLISADELDEEHEIVDPAEIAELFAAIAATAYEAGLSAKDLHTLVDVAIERDGMEMN